MTFSLCVISALTFQVPARQFYEQEVARLKLKRDKELRKAKLQPLPICFVTFQRSDDADR